MVQVLTDPDLRILRSYMCSDGGLLMDDQFGTLFFRERSKLDIGIQVSSHWLNIHTLFIISSHQHSLSSSVQGRRRFVCSSLRLFAWSHCKCYLTNTKDNHWIAYNEAS